MEAIKQFAADFAPLFSWITAKGLISGIGTLVATFLGAFFAFQFAKVQRERERTDKEIAAGNRALYILTTIFDQTYQHQEEIVASKRGKPDAWLNLAAASPLSENIGFDLTDLSFVLQSEPAVFAQVLLEEQRFRLLAHMIGDHRSLVLDLVWP
jgi:lipid-binding SYLF domain-containing protein